MPIKFFLTALLLCCRPALAADQTALTDPFSPSSAANADSSLSPLQTVENQCGDNTEWLMDNWPLQQLKPIGLIHYPQYAVVLWLTPTEVIIDSRLNHVIAEEQWQIVNIENRQIRLQNCQNPAQQKTIHL
ncbi:hypothetical protein A1D23_04025 [Chelonobacter oris]|uniref:hypothetical protein n=1 Tax=Chelonobacter oris TaxID=505317 RepID=UPI00244B86B8|nr:hypothetical protein [Chelonobacter oris]MDH2999273.1 hypothetical protein [Chelonobacter oris]